MFCNPKPIPAIASLWLGLCSLPVAAQTHSPAASYSVGAPQFNVHMESSRCAPRFYPIMALAPKDGGRTLSSYPTFYWYVSLPSASEGKDRVHWVTFILRDGAERASKSAFKVSVKITQSGLYKLTLPASAPPLKAGILQSWQLRFYRDGEDPYSVRTAIVLEKNPSLEKEISQSRTEIEKAQIYVKHYYWYDALAAYSNWLEANPNDEVARRARSELLVSVIGMDNKSKCSDGKYTTTAEINAKSPVVLEDFRPAKK